MGTYIMGSNPFMKQNLVFKWRKVEGQAQTMPHRTLGIAWLLESESKHKFSKKVTSYQYLGPLIKSQVLLNFFDGVERN